MLQLQFGHGLFCLYLAVHLDTECAEMGGELRIYLGVVTSIAVNVYTSVLLRTTQYASPPVPSAVMVPSLTPNICPVSWKCVKA